MEEVTAPGSAGGDALAKVVITMGREPWAPSNVPENNSNTNQKKPLLRKYSKRGFFLEKM